MQSFLDGGIKWKNVTKTLLFWLQQRPVLRVRDGNQAARLSILKDKQEQLQDLKLDIDYDTAEQAKRAGLVFAKKWVDAKL